MPRFVRRDPRVKLLISYDIVTEVRQEYYEFILREFVPKLQEVQIKVVPYREGFQF
jgi:hypothetical protein